MDWIERRLWRCIRSFLILCAVMGLGAGSSPAGSATTFFVRTTGDDANDGLTPETALRSIRSAGRLLLNPGDRVVVGPGEYFEGNIEPRRGGAPGAPIAFIADTGGSLTGDPAGPVVVRPDGSRIDETTGFIVFGEHHIRIEGFTVVGAVDAGIQVRPSAQTGGSSADVTIVGNVLRDCRHGIDMQEVTRVVIADNEASGNDLSGIFLRGGSKPTADATVRDNRLVGNAWGILTLAVRRGLFENNRFEGGRAGVRLDAGDDLVVAQSTFRDCTSAVSLRHGPTNVAVTDNLVEGCRSGVRGSAGDGLLFARNRVVGLSGAFLPLAAAGSVTVEDNELRDGRIVQSIFGATTFALRRNSIEGYVRLHVQATVGAHLSDNHLDGGARGIRITAPQIVVEANHLLSVGGFLLRGETVVFGGNQIEGGTRTISIDAAEVDATNNDLEGPGAGFSYEAQLASQGFTRFAGNHIRGGRGIFVRDRTTATDVLITDNRIVDPAGSGITVRTLGSAELVSNEVLRAGAHGISLQLDRNVSAVRIEGNVVTGGDAAITLQGARSASILDNQIDGPSGYGVRVRDAELVAVERNQVSGPGNDAINVAGDAILLGDCDRDGVVTASEVQRGMRRLFVEDVAGDCSALGPNRRGRISVASWLAAVLNHAAEQPGPKPSGQVEILDNHLVGGGGAGIVAYARDRLTIRDNAVLGSGETGISATGAPHAALILEGNAVENSGNDCMLVSGGDSARLADGSATLCAESGVRARDTRSVSLERNEIRGAGEPAVMATAVLGWRSGDNVVADSVGGFALIGPDLVRRGGTYGSLSAVLEDENVERSWGVALLISRTSFAAASGCRVANSARHGIAIRSARTVNLVENVILDAGESGVSIGTAAEPGGGDVIVDGNLVLDFRDAAIDINATTGNVLVTRNEADGGPSSTEASVAVRYGVDSGGVAAVTGNRIRAALGDGVRVENAVRAFVWDNAVYSAGHCGVFVTGAESTEVVNTLVYGNAEHGIHLERPGAARVFNNTVYGNGGWGLVSGGAVSAAILNNIFDANALGSVLIAPAGAGVDEGFNLTTGPYAGLEPAPSDLFEPPRFVDPDGADDVLGADGAADDDFRLRAESPAIDAGSNVAELFGISGSATEDGQRDLGPVDLGFHYDASPRVP